MTKYRVFADSNDMGIFAGKSRQDALEAFYVAHPGYSPQNEVGAELLGKPEILVVPVTEDEIKFPYAIYRTRKHGGGLVSRHATREEAEEAFWALTERAPGFSGWCVGVASPLTEATLLRASEEGPDYELAR